MRNRNCLTCRLCYNSNMTTQVKKYVISFPSRPAAKSAGHRGFYELAKKHIVKGKRGGSRDLSKHIDEVVYGV